MAVLFFLARCGRLLTIVGQPPSPQQQPHQRPIAVADTGPTGTSTIGTGNIALADAAIGVGHHLGFPTLGSVGDDAVGDAAAACPGTAAVVGAGCYSETGRPGVAGSGGWETSGRRPLIKAGAEDLVGLNPQQLIEQVLAAREAVVQAMERADAAERAAALPDFFRSGEEGPGDVEGGGNKAGTDRWRFFAGHGIGGSGGDERAREVEGAPTDGAVEELLSRRLLASAVEDFSSVVGEFSEVSRIWLKEVGRLSTCFLRASW